MRAHVQSASRTICEIGFISSIYGQFEALDQFLLSSQNFFGLIEGGCQDSAKPAVSRQMFMRFGQWQGRYPGKPGIGRSFGPQIRSEMSALLEVLHGLWQYHLDVEGGDGLVGDVTIAAYVEELAMRITTQVS